MERSLREAHKRLADIHMSSRGRSSPPNTAPKSGLATDLAAFRQLRAARLDPDRRAPHHLPPDDAESSLGDEASELSAYEHAGLGRGRTAFIDMVAWAEARIVEANLAAETATHENARLRRLLARRESEPDAAEYTARRRSASPALARSPQPRATSPYGAEPADGAEASRLRARVAQLELELASAAHDRAHAERAMHARHASFSAHERSSHHRPSPSLADVGSVAYGDELSGGESFHTLRLLRLLQERDAELLRLRHDRSLAVERERASVSAAAQAQPRFEPSAWAQPGQGAEEGSEEPSAKVPHRHVHHRPPPPTPAAQAGPAQPRGTTTPSTVGQMLFPAPVTAGRLEPLPVLRELTRVYLAGGDEPAPVGLRALCTELQLQLGYVLDMLEAQTERSERLRSQHIYAAQARGAVASPSLSA